MMRTLNSIGYSIYFDNTIAELVQFIKRGKYSRCFVLTDENTGEHCLPILKDQFEDIEFDIVEINAGEENKNIDFCIGVWKTLIDFGADRQSLMINLGGGVIGDMGGFVASTYKRGVDFVNVPTTLLSQVDASVGGKTGIDMDGIKNIIGTFTQPKAVFIEHSFLATLPARQILSGTAEMLKHGLIMDANYWNDLKNSDLSNPSPELIHRSVAIKNEVVIEDPHEKGIRKALNFGHTIGHAVETNSLLNDKHPLTHGEAIAIGIVAEAWLSHKKRSLSEAELTEIASVIKSHYPKYHIEPSSHDALHELMLKDKKNYGAQINCTLINKIGECHIDNVCSKEELLASLEYYASV